MNVKKIFPSIREKSTNEKKKEEKCVQQQKCDTQLMKMGKEKVHISSVLGI